MRQKLVVLYFNVALFCVLLVAGELIGQVLFFLLKGYPVYQSTYGDNRLNWHRRLLEQHPYLVGRLRSNVRIEEDGKVVTTTAAHTRWTGASSDARNAIRIAVIGGSTTFGAGVSDSETWAAQLQNLLGPRYHVTNFGLLGYSSAEAIIQMALIVPESRPDIVVLYEGWNDIRNYHETDLSPDYYGHGTRQFTTLNIAHSQQEPLLVRLATISAICRLAWTLSKEIHATAPMESLKPEQVFQDPRPLCGPDLSAQSRDAEAACPAVWSVCFVRSSGAQRLVV